MSLDMNLSDFICQAKAIYTDILHYIENDDEFLNEEGIKNIFDELDMNREKLISFLRLISKISNNYHRIINFDTKIQRILSILFDKVKQTLSNSEIFNIFKKNKRILLYLLQKQIITIDEIITNYFLSDDSYSHFFYPEIKDKIDEKEKRRIEEKLLSIDQNIFSVFEYKRQCGENDSYICTLIRQDSVEEFVSYTNQASNISLSSKINKSFFETNSFLLKNEPTLIEYSAFYGSIQIFQYLRMNNVKLTETLWLYAVHSSNAELIHLLEENRINFDEIKYEDILIESIKCHHNDIADYIQSNLIVNQNNNESQLSEKVMNNVIRYYNYYYFPDDFIEDDSFFYLSRYKHYIIVDFLMNSITKDMKDKNALNSI